MDWGLLEMKSGDNKFLREETVYSSNVGQIWIIVALLFDRHLFERFIYKYFAFTNSILNANY